MPSVSRLDDRTDYGVKVMNPELVTRITGRLNEVGGYASSDIIAGIDYADRNGYNNDNDALSIVIAYILYGKDECDGGARYPIEPGSW